MLQWPSWVRSENGFVVSARTPLTEAGRENVFNLEGSIFQWASEGRPLADGKGAATRVHPYGRRWRLLLKPERRGAID